MPDEIMLISILHSNDSGKMREEFRQIRAKIRAKSGEKKIKKRQQKIRAKVRAKSGGGK